MVMTVCHAAAVRAFALSIAAMSCSFDVRRPTAPPKLSPFSACCRTYVLTPMPHAPPPSPSPFTLLDASAHTSLVRRAVATAQGPEGGYVSKYWWLLWTSHCSPGPPRVSELVCEHGNLKCCLEKNVACVAAHHEGVPTLWLAVASHMPSSLPTHTLQPPRGAAIGQGSRCAAVGVRR